MRVAFTGFKQVSGFCSVDTAERDLQAYLAELESNGVCYTVSEFGNDYSTGYLVETDCPPDLHEKGTTRNDN